MISQTQFHPQGKVSIEENKEIEFSNLWNRATVTITNKVGEEIFTKEFNEEEPFQEFLKKYIVSFSGHTFCRSLLIPPSTHSCKNLALNILCPTLANYSFKQKGMVKTACGVFAGMILDTVCLIPRLISTPFRKCILQSPTPHPLFALVDDVPKIKNSLKDGYVVVHISLHKNEIAEELHHENHGYFKDITRTTKISFPIITNNGSHCPITKEIEVEKSEEITHRFGKVKGSQEIDLLLNDPPVVSSKKYRSTYFIKGFEEAAHKQMTLATSISLP